MRAFAVFIFVSWAPLIAAGASEIKNCAAIAASDFSRVADAPTHVTGAREVPAAAPSPAYCKVEGYIAGRIGLELRLPRSAWNGKMMFQGCGGYCGSLIQMEQCMDALARGYACVHTDLGHVSTASDAKWAYNNPQAEIDFYYRATHAAAQGGKAIIAQAYDTPATRHYYQGCSTGGRQGLISAQRFPEDFDGIIVGAPAGVSAGGGLHLIWSALANLDAEGRSIMSDKKVPMLASAVMQKCDAMDGLADGLIDDPRRCDFDPAELACKTGQDPAQCLSDAEVSVVRKIYAGATTTSGRRLYTATPMLGSEPTWVPVFIGANGQKPGYYYFGGDFFRYLAFAEDPGPRWKPEDFDFERDPPRMGYNRHLNNAADPDLRAFKARGGKLIAYQGWRDYSVPPLAIVDYYELVERVMGGRDATQEFFRLFMLPGVDHCAGGPGPARMDLMAALEAWVERDRAPGEIIAARIKNDPGILGNVYFPLKADEIEVTRPVYPYPEVARYVGQGDPNRAENFRRTSPK
ncbi:MAG: tannase/feruloyl esterase family alpha/beta hydrolase [Rhodospirillaceae bacterium]|nr:tannase/feruloyl esterase family alpha/beta hydrolase [Rhodospirillaceae bacterium]